MASKFLPVFIGNALGDNEELLPAFTAGKGGLKEALRFCQNFRIAGIGSLLMSGTAARFHECLHASARAFVQFASAAPEAQKLTSRAEPFFDAVACGDTEAARELARLLPRAADKNREYEEDFLFVRFLMDHFFLGRDASEGRDLLERYEKVLEGSEDPRLAVCHALLAVDGAGFDDALTRMMNAREVRFGKLRDKEALEPEVLETEGYVSIEGLALVRLAVSKGLQPLEDVLFIPSVAREQVRLRYRADIWKQLLA
ncbi:Imm49 family immunity protein [Pyxidicoccus caerfyrddinensis]|uniref:Imm49 family immunity protein n=1 Tax=Pyxidicoccus caerfyrddinensis TaxID=2709663 RepID=UPI0013DCD193|nr:Imm49 family immunity protein [Pyxidicoccus caerfyrddinensis]